MKKLIPLWAVGSLLLSTTTAYSMESITWQQWTQFQRGIQLAQYPPLARIIEEFDREKDRRIVVLYPGGEIGHNTALELRDWFVALGVPSRLISLEPGSGLPDTMLIRVDELGFK